MAKTKEERRKDAREGMARMRKWIKDKDPESYEAYKTYDKERKQEERR